MRTLLLYLPEAINFLENILAKSIILHEIGSAICNCEEKSSQKNGNIFCPANFRVAPVTCQDSQTKPFSQIWSEKSLSE